MNDEVFLEIESNVRSYCRIFPAVFVRGKGARLYDETGKEYIDFFAGAGALNFGHNNEYIKARLLEYIERDGLVHGLDMHTTAKRDFLVALSSLVLRPKQLDYKVQFCSPSGANAVEAALKLARKVKRRPGVFAFMGSYHGMSLGSLAVTGDLASRAGAGVPLAGVTFLPFPNGFMSATDTIGYIERILGDTYSGVETPAAIVFESVQAEGGVYVAPLEWLRQLRTLCNEHDILLICDDIQAGCFRTGPFFSFERYGIIPDMVTLSKSIGGYGLPMSLLLMKPVLDIWKPGEHTGTFRGNQLAFVGATAALEYATQSEFDRLAHTSATFLEHFLRVEISLALERVGKFEVRGIGHIWGIDLGELGDSYAQRVVTRCFELGLLLERVGRNGSVIKLLPPLTIDLESLATGCSILKRALEVIREPS